MKRKERKNKKWYKNQENEAKHKRNGKNKKERKAKDIKQIGILKKNQEKKEKEKTGKKIQKKKLNICSETSKELRIRVFLSNLSSFKGNLAVSDLCRSFKIKNNLVLWRGWCSHNSKECSHKFSSDVFLLTLSEPTSQNGQTHSNISSVKAADFVECVWPFCGVDA